MRVLFFLLTLPLLLLLCVLVAYRTPLPAALEGSRDLVAAVAAGLLGVGYLAALLVYLILSLRRASLALDAALTSSGWRAMWAPPFGRRYTGHLAGCAARIVYRPAFALQPAALDVTVDAHPRQRLAASSGPQRPLFDCRNGSCLALSELPGVHLYAEDEAAARALLARPEVRSALRRLLTPPEVSGPRELYLQPHRAWFRAHLRTPPDATAATLTDLLFALSTLVEASCQVQL